MGKSATEEQLLCVEFCSVWKFLLSAFENSSNPLALQLSSLNLATVRNLAH